MIAPRGILKTEAVKPAVKAANQLAEYFLFLRRDYLVFRAAFPVIQRLKCLKNRTKIFIVAEIRNCTLRLLFRV